MDICSKDPALDERFAREMGPADESSYEAVKRAYVGICNRIYNNVRADYDEARDIVPYVDEEQFVVHSFKLRAADNVQLACCHLQYKPHLLPAGRDPCVVIFLHTNARNLLQALDLLPFCTAVQSSLLAYDLRGCGKSDGPGLNSLERHLADLERVIAWAQSNSMKPAGSQKIVLWAR